LAEIENRPIAAGDVERHSIFSLLALALAADAFSRCVQWQQERRGRRVTC
jgi:hypothetical protein